MKKLKIIISIIVVTFLLTGCNGNVTRDLRHAGFNLSTEKFVCKELIPEKESDAYYNKLMYMNNEYAITNDGKIYEITFGKTYANKTNCKKATFDKKVVAMMDENIIKADDNKLYYTPSDKSSPAYSEVTVNDNSYEIYNIIFQTPDVKKVKTVDASNGIYYVLSNDGNVYKYIINRPDFNSPYQLISKEAIYKVAQYGKIKDFNYAGEENTATYIRTDYEVYKVQITNQEECNKYADVTCKYEFKKDEVLSKYFTDKILYYGPGKLITTYGKIFS